MYTINPKKRAIPVQKLFRATTNVILNNCLDLHICVCNNSMTYRVEISCTVCDAWMEYNIWYVCDIYVYIHTHIHTYMNIYIYLYVCIYI